MLALANDVPEDKKLSVRDASINGHSKVGKGRRRLPVIRKKPTYSGALQNKYRHWRENSVPPDSGDSGILVILP